MNRRPYPATAKLVCAASRRRAVASSGRSPNPDVNSLVLLHGAQIAVQPVEDFADQGRCGPSECHAVRPLWRGYSCLPRPHSWGRKAKSDARSRTPLPPVALLLHGAQIAIQPVETSRIRAVRSSRVSSGSPFVARTLVSAESPLLGTQSAFLP